MKEKKQNKVKYSDLLKDQSVKKDKGKPALDLLPIDALLQVSRCFEYGAEKYGVLSWKTSDNISYNRIYAAILRHMFAWWEGEDIDPESGLNHLNHVCTNALILLSHIHNSRSDLDNRPTSKDNKDKVDVCDSDKVYCLSKKGSLKF